MKRIYIKTYVGAALLALFLVGCSKVLKETPRAIYTPEYFKTSAGVMGGLTALYANMRYVYGGYFYSACQTGTDEATWATNANGNFKDLDLSGVGSVTPSSSRSDVLWNTVFSNINTASGIVENATAVGTIPNSLIAEARFFRAFDYFLLVQNFGGVPLDLGAGRLKFNTSAVRTSIRDSVTTVYTKGIFPDLLIAINDLPASGRITGGLAKTVARLYLAKAYLTYGWWLENPNNIATYPTCANRTDPDGHTASWYYQQAYNVALAGIASPGSFGLQPTFYQVNVATNERNNEMLLYADHTQASELYNATSLTYSTGSAPESFAYWFTQWNYPLVRSSSSSTSWSAVSSVQRSATQLLGRPWYSMVPPIGVFTNTFADKTNDSRYDGTFTSVYRGNWNLSGSGVSSTTLYNANNLPVAPGDAILTFLDNEPGTPIAYPVGLGQSNVGAGVLPGRSDWVIAPSGISRMCYPGLWKIGCYRTDNGAGFGSPNGANTRPFYIAKFSELYFIAAEAAVKGATTTAGNSARELINVIRARAGKWTWSNNGNVAKVADNSAAMIAATPATIDINYILAERSREYFGEGYRWNDLVRTQKLAEIAGTYQICGTAYGDHTIATVNRTISNYLYLRPVPVSQFDGMQMSDSLKVGYQNPGY